ncbi:MAG: MBOAT family protein [Cyclobacteriaceae bacterium]|nr:MBOAT family protein [Cyclobacteriaceae bacterium]
MLFNSISFLAFFPLVTVIYYLLPHRWRWLHLLLASCVFYMFFVPAYILILLITILIDYFAGIWIENTTGPKKRWYLWISIISTCLVLFVFKYYNFFIDNFNGLANLIGWNYSLTSLAIILPIGLSFHTFQSLSYVIEVYRGKQKAEKNFGIYSLYVMYYPQLVAGPIERPQNLLHQFRKEQKFKFANFFRGLRLMVYGFFLKLVVADRLAIYVNAVYNNSDQHGGATLALATAFFAFQIYADFAGYSSIAIGASRMMGIKLMTNFRRPYLSASVAEFWRRWHISLSTWFRDYLYISLGGNRVSSVFRRQFNLMITFLVSGFWHGANWTYVVWGGLNGVYLNVASALGLRASFGNALRPLKVLGVFVLICVTWIYFRAESIAQANAIGLKILQLEGPLFIPSDPEIFVYCVFSIAFLLSMEIGYESFYQKRRIRINVQRFANLLMLTLTLMIMLIGVFDGGQFIYFQF